MKAELRARAIEAAARSTYEHENRIGRWTDSWPWDQAQPHWKAQYRRKAERHVVAALSEVADWCDEQIAKIVYYGQSPDGFVCEEEAFQRVAGACRPGGED